MYKLSIPVGAHCLTDEELPAFIEEFKKAEVDRIFLTMTLGIYRSDSYLYKETERMRYLISLLKSEGFEVGVWIGGFGHGSLLAGVPEGTYKGEFTKIRGADGREAEEGFCPLDENFRKCYADAVELVASLNPHIIMIDDDFRLDIRQYELGCCCDAHLKLFSDAVGEDIPLEKVEELVFTGGENKYRTEWLKLKGKTLVDFAKLMRETVDKVNPNIRLGCCAVYTTWDFEGTDLIELSKAFAGKTKPFIRTIGAPYHGMRVQYAVEHVRMQSAWCEGEDIEIFTEGDVYPRPRYNVPSKYLEIFDLALVASGATDGILKYMFDYMQKADYEKGYNARHVKNKGLRDSLRALFDGKNHVGVRVFEQMHKVGKYELPKEYVKDVSKFVWNTYFSIAQKVMSENAIPTVYGGCGEYPTIAFGENARYLCENDMKNGVVTDAVGAKILAERGIDAGYVKSEPCRYFAERFISADDEISSLSSVVMHKAVCADSINVKSTFVPDGDVASYTYENANGLRFYVLLIDAYRTNKNSLNYFNNYYRQSDMIKALEWLSGKNLPAKCSKNPFLYIQTAKSEDQKKMSVALFNMCIDDVIDAEIVLDKEYKDIKFLNCDGELFKNVVKLNTDIKSYETAAFEVTE